MNKLIPAKYLYLLSNFLQIEQNINLVDICKKKGIVFSEKIDDFIDNKRFSEICEAALESINQDNIGLKFGSTLRFTHFGPLGAAMMSCKTIQDILDLTMMFSVNTFPFEISVENKEDKTHIIQHLPDYFTPSILFHIQTSFVGCIQFLKEVAGFIPKEIELRFPYPKPNKMQLKHYQTLLPYKLNFSQPEAVIIIPKSYLEIPLPRHDETSKQLFIDICKDIQIRLTQQRKLSNKISLLLDSYDCYPTLEQLANILHISDRTLRNHLQKENCCYSDLVVVHKLQRAKKLLTESSLSIERIAEQVGYKDTASFYRAFKKITQQTPLKYRNTKRN